MNDNIFEMKKRTGHATSFWMHDPKDIFDKLELNEGDVFLDLGCGIGDYSIYASKIVGDNGKIIAIDKVKANIDRLLDTIDTKHIKNISIFESDIRSELLIDDNTVDHCFISTVLHILDKDFDGLFKEIRRVLKNGSKCSIIECKKKEFGFGPPLDMRLEPVEILKSASKYGFHQIDYLDLKYNYMLILQLSY